MSSDYPFADGYNLVWDLTGFGDADEEIVESVSLSRDQYLKIRHLFVLGDDPWMVSGEYRVAPSIWAHVRSAVPGVRFQRDADYFLGARQALPDGRFWRPAPGVAAPGPIPPP
ncbi:hypothetical protein [Streptomyces sp. NBC_00091]|uniref:hypothetical protein n=1 Tax=Streptomyces sp. NBC_00091 TaxID=2975648 RepID=UPI00225363E0|nr:hypothetical protein [Streptomyces sp. NBC_00091]MCX5376615.1 hypothetical protein [Streptomyces sp. NBC_00091]